MKKYFAILITLISAGIFASCNNSTAPANTSTIPTTPNTMVITVGGVTDTLVATAYDTSYSGVKGIVVTGVGLSGVNVSILLANITTTNSYNVGSLSISGTSPVYVVMSYTAFVNGTTTTYTSPTNPTAAFTPVGTLTVAALTSTNIQAAFNATLTQQNGTATVSITNGGVNATFL
ncbi:MAG TPA: hypothetical protein VGM92_09745 [Candidatus Kapabacteria bacterium]|jgi:hypothetical protein